MSLRTLRPFALASLALLAACGQASTTVTCTPACPTGSTCTAAGCVFAGLDMSVGPPPDLGGGGDCQPACGSPTPVCQAGVCVACGADTDCPMGSVCGQLGSQPICLPGCKGDARCGGGSKKCCNSQCVDVSSDGNNCGDCNAGCVAPMASSTCVGGVCATGACTAGYGDCNGDASDGCEANLRVDAKNCGACNTTCKIDHGTPGCSGSCYVAACDFGFGDCDGNPVNGCEQATLSDVHNCGDCGHTCDSLPHAVVGCINASCGLTACAAGFADCDGLVQNGCETGTASDGNNCGACGNACAKGLVCRNGACTCPNCNFPNAKSVCTNNMCGLGQCLKGFGDCNKVAKDGCELDLTYDAKNCGACGNECPPNMAFCTSGVCTDINNSALLIYASSYHSDVKNTVVNTGAFTMVDEFDAEHGTPKVDQMLPYGAVLVYSDASFQDPTTLGDNLADYFDMGGWVVVAVFADASVPVKGRFGNVANGYMMIQPNGQEEPNDSLGVIADPNSPLVLDLNKLTAMSSYRSTGGAINGGTVVASWNSGKPLIVAGTVNGRNIVALNCYPPSTIARGDFLSGDVGPLLRNALLYR